jgi:hypothetical protein
MIFNQEIQTSCLSMLLIRKYIHWTCYCTVHVHVYVIFVIVCVLFEWKWLSFAIQLLRGAGWNPIIRFNPATNVHILFLNVFYGGQIPTTEFV